MKKVFFIAPGDSSFRRPIIKAFERLGWKVKFFDYRKGDLLIRIYRFLPIFGGFEKAKKAIESKILRISKDFNPNLIYINKGETLTNELVKKLKKIGAITINLFPEYLNYWHLAKNLSSVYDIFVIFDHPLEKNLKAIGRKNIYYLPFGAEIHHNKKLKKEYEMSFVGTWRPSRERRLSKLVEFDLNIWVDPRWSKSSLRKFFRGGRISQNEMITVIKKSKINLNIYFDGWKLDGAALRIFETTGCGEFLLSEYKHSLEKLYKLDKEIVCYKTIKEQKQKIKYFLKNDIEREAVAKAGYDRAKKDHTWEKRLKELLKIVSKFKRT